ncbi:MAG: alpha-glucuronidase family glycosyl hydrolase [Chitinophagaceae bacterium]
MQKIISLVLLLVTATLHAENGYRLWLRYDAVSNKQLQASYRKQLHWITADSNSIVLQTARKELQAGLTGLLAQPVTFTNTIRPEGSLLIGTLQNPAIKNAVSKEKLQDTGEEGYCIFTQRTGQGTLTIIAANTDKGVLYGVFHLLRLLQTQQPISALKIFSKPRIQHRLLNHWDNLNGTVERGYAGFSLWNWHKLPGYIDQRYIDYARANASIGINGTVLTNVNANAFILTKEYLQKVAALANTFRPYGIRVYLTARFSAPVEIGGLKTADPLDPQVQAWWQQKVKEIYHYIPDFGGFLVKANSEGQPGPQNYGRNHADGANMLADALAPFNGIVMWRAFVYSSETPEDRFKQAWNEFTPLDGKFRKNVIVQVKNGPIDFQPREPFHPLFGAMPATPLMMEFQLTQEYLGFSTHLVFLPTLFKECLDADTYAKGPHTTVASVVDGTADHHALSGMAGVANIGNDINWCGHPFAQANWYSFGRLAWDHELSSSQLADEWIRQTFSNEKVFVDSVRRMMLLSRETLVNYMTPLGLHHIMGYGHHYGPAPWHDKAPRADWNPVYFHKADSAGIGFNRTATGSNALAQYQPEVRKQFENLATCPEDYLLWFHHVPWTYRLQSGRNLWQELCYKYYSGVDSVRWMQHTWQQMKKYVDNERFEQVRMLLAIQEEEAVWWRNACLLYFQTFANMPLPQGAEQPDHTLDYYKGLRFPYAPGN